MMKLLRHGGVVSGALTAAALMWQVTQAGAWSLEEAAKPYSGQTIRLVGELLPPLEALKKMAPQFEKLTGITVEVEMYEHSEAVTAAQPLVGRRVQRVEALLSVATVRPLASSSDKREDPCIR